MQLRIDKFITAKVTHVNKRTENHGNKLIHAIDLNWRIDCPNTSLDVMFGEAGRQLRLGAYEAADSQDLPGVDSATPKLRAIFSLIKGPHTLKFDGTGYMLTIKTGEVSGESIELADVELSKSDYDPKDGGSTTVTFKSAHSGLNKKLLGELASLDGREVSLLCAPPLLQEGTTPDKKKGAAAKDDKTIPLPLNTPRQPKATQKAPEQALVEDSKPATAKQLKEAERVAEKARRFPTAAKKAAAKKVAKK